MIYLVMFSSVIGLTYIYEHSGKVHYGSRGERVLHGILGITIILLPSLLGGFRDLSVGTDNEVYATFVKYCSQHTLPEIMEWSGGPEPIEKGFLLLVYCITKISPEYYMFAFVTSMLSFGLIFVGAKMHKEKYSMVVIVTAYLFLYYCPMLNYVRQSVALGLVFVGIGLAEKKHYLKFLILVLIASTIHTSAIVALPIVFLFIYKDRIHFNKYNFLVIVAIILVLMAGPQLIYNALVILSKTGIRTETILKYSRRFLYSSGYSLAPALLIRSVPQVIIFSCFYKQLVNEDSSMKSLYLMCWIQLPITIMGSVYDAFSRVGFYYNYSVFLLFACLYNVYVKRSQRVIFIIIFLFYLLFYWYFFTVMNHYGFQKPVYPYTSIF